MGGELSIFATEAAVAYVVFSLRLAENYAPFVRHAGVNSVEETEARNARGVTLACCRNRHLAVTCWDCNRPHSSASRWCCIELWPWSRSLAAAAAAEEGRTERVHVQESARRGPREG